MAFTFASTGFSRARIPSFPGPLKLGLLVLLVLFLWVIVSQPSDHRVPSPERTVRYNGVKDFLICPEETSMIQLHGHTDGPSVLSTLSPRCRELTRTLLLSKHIISQILLVGAEQMDAATRFADICDSLDKREILTAFQKQFNVTITDELISNITTLGDAVGAVEELRLKDGFPAPVTLD
ncbi:hypothetical protein R1sor_013137 [Riccia sorocarpa]|uniref:Carrier domain-containing protein n=1 Tax=Riccia sorocarpa TaxID=122646 RepID=A0ABD3H689_9MARC